MTSSASQRLRRNAAFACACLALLAESAFAQVVDQQMWVPNGPVSAIARDAGTLYLGGSFDRVGPATGSGVPIDAGTAAARAGFPKVVGNVYCVAADGSGGWYIGGDFVSVGGFPRTHLARVAADLSVSAWNPSPNQVVEALAVSGATVYAGGSFTNIGGEERRFIAALDAITGMATAWNPIGSGPVRALAVSGPTVFAAGSFSTIGGMPRSNIAAIDATTGAATSWDPSADAGVSALALAGSTLYAAGSFTAIGGEARGLVAALDVATGAATSWDPGLIGDWVVSIAVSGNLVYVGGTFYSVGGQERGNLAAIDATTGVPTAWDPGADGDVRAIVPAAGIVYVGGRFEAIGGAARDHLAALDAATGQATAWHPRIDDDVIALGLSGSTIFAGGLFNSVGGVARNNLVALDVSTGAATAWDPNADQPVTALAVKGSTVYAGGAFTSIGGQARNGLAALDRVTGAAASWDPNAGGTGFQPAVGALAVSDDLVYVGGRFTSIGGQSRNHIAALDPVTAQATSWNPNASGAVTPFISALVLDGSTLYVAGTFDVIGGMTRHSLAALSTASGLATLWDPDPNSGVRALAIRGTTVYVGGSFTTIGSQLRNRIAALDATTGLATGWNPDVTGALASVGALALHNTEIYAGGRFTGIGGQSRNNLAALDVTTGAATAWSPGTRAKVGRVPSVNALLANGTAVYAGGGFTDVGGSPQAFFAAMGDQSTPVLLSLESALAEPRRVRLAWFAAAPVEATVYRRTATRDWVALGTILSDGTGRLAYDDVDVTPGERYGYRLGIREGDREQLSSETWVEVPRALDFALAGPRPHPAAGELAVAFSLPDASPARLDVLDLAGRRVASREVGALGAGNHVVHLGRERRIAPGMYVVRLARGGRSLATRAIVID